MRPRQTFEGVDQAGIDAVATLFQTSPERQPWNLPNDTLGVWSVQHRSESGNVRLLLWPAINRLDVMVGPHMWVVKGIEELEVIDELELIARFGANGVISVALNGQIVLTTTASTS